GKEKTYVQHRMREVARDLWAWINDGAHIYVCGDALRMAKDVENALTDMVAEQSGRSAAEAAKFVDELKAQGRYQADAYYGADFTSAHFRAGGNPEGGTNRRVSAFAGTRA